MMKEITLQPNLESLRDTKPKHVGVSPVESFSQVLTRSINQVNQLQTQADEAVRNLATGKQTDIHQTMIAVEKASISFELLMQIRNKIVSAYETLMRTQI